MLQEDKKGAAFDHNAHLCVHVSNFTLPFPPQKMGYPGQFVGIFLNNISKTLCLPHRGLAPLTWTVSQNRETCSLIGSSSFVFIHKQDKKTRVLPDDLLWHVFKHSRSFGFMLLFQSPLCPPWLKSWLILMDWACFFFFPSETVYALLKKLQPLVLLWKEHCLGGVHSLCQY